MKQDPHIQLVIALSLIAVIVSYIPVRAWNAPIGTFPNKNIAAPLTTGSTAEVKNGDLTVGYFSAWQNAYFANQVSIGGILRGDQPGTPTATSTLNIGGTDLGGNGSNVTRTMSLNVTKGNTQAFSFLSPTIINTKTSTGSTPVGGVTVTTNNSTNTVSMPTVSVAVDYSTHKVKVSVDKPLTATAKFTISVRLTDTFWKKLNPNDTSNTPIESVNDVTATITATADGTTLSYMASTALPWINPAGGSSSTVGQQGTYVNYVCVSSVTNAQSLYIPGTDTCNGNPIGTSPVTTTTPTVTINTTSTASVDGLLCADATGTIILCTVPTVAVADFCKNIAATTALPAGMYKDTDGNCYTSACTNKNVQTVPAGEVKNADGSCSVPVVADFCSNIPNSTALPSGFIKMSDGGCYQIPNVTNLQSTVAYDATNDNGVITGSIQLDSSLLSDTTFTVKLLIKLRCRPSELNSAYQCGFSGGSMFTASSKTISVSATKGMKQIPFSFTETYATSRYIPTAIPVTQCVQVDSPSTSEIPLTGSFHC